VQQCRPYLTDYSRGELDQLGYILRVGYRFAPCLVFATCSILCLTDTDDVVLLELQVAVLLILHLRLC